MEVYIIDLQRQRHLQLVLKLDFTAHGIMESLSEFGFRKKQKKDMVYSLYTPTLSKQFRPFPLKLRSVSELKIVLLLLLFCSTFHVKKTFQYFLLVLLFIFCKYFITVLKPSVSLNQDEASSIIVVGCLFEPTNIYNLLEYRQRVL